MQDIVLFILAPFFVQAFGHVLSVILGFVGNWVYLDRDSEVERLDDWLAKNGYCTRRDTDGSALGGLHAGRLGKGFFVTYRSLVAITANSSRDHHNVFTWRCREEFVGIVCGDPDSIRDLTANAAGMGWVDLNVGRIRFREVPRPWQFAALTRVLEEYDRTDTAGALIMGRSGAGKTTLCYVIARWLQEYRQCKPMVLASFSPQTSGMSLQSCLAHTPTRTRPFVMVINEWDKIVEQAEAGSASSGHEAPQCAASSKGTLLDLIDGIRRRPFVILIVTTNLGDLVECREDSQAARHPYVNRHRFPVCVEAR